MIFERIKLLRKKLNLSQKEFGDRLGVSRDVIANIENNRVEPQKILVQHLCNTFKINIKWIEDGLGEIFVNNNENLAEATRLFDQLAPEFQKYVIQQMSELLLIQENDK